MSTRPFDYIRTTAELRKTADDLGSPYFSPDTMRFFNSRLSEQIKTQDRSSGWFIISNQDMGGYSYDAQPREYRVVRYDVTSYVRQPEGRVCDKINFESVGDPYPSMKAAKAALRNL